MGLWSTQTKVEGIMLKAAWHWGSESSIIDDPLGEPDHTLLYVGLQSSWGSVNIDLTFSPFLWEGSLTGDSDGYKWMNKPLALEVEHLYPEGPCWESWRGGLLTGDFGVKVNY
jgi:hypothetical protein